MTEKHALNDALHMVVRAWNPTCMSGKERGRAARGLDEVSVRVVGRAQVAFVEIYNDDIRDLLGDSDAPSAIAVRESPERGPSWRTSSAL